MMSLELTALRILVVEDDIDARGLLLLALQGLGHDARAVGDAHAACAEIVGGEIDVVLSDWILPGMSGLDLCQHVRRTERDRYIYFVLVTGFGDGEHFAEAIRAGADDVQRKPVDVDELDARLVMAARTLALHRRLPDRYAARAHSKIS